MAKGIVRIGGPDGVDQEVKNSTISQKNGCWYLLYKDTLPGWENASTKIKCREGFLEMTRSGAKSMRMVFDAGKLFYMKYPTPYGEIDLEYCTETVELSGNGQETIAKVTYTIVGDDETKRILIVSWIEE